MSRAKHKEAMRRQARIHEKEMRNLRIRGDLSVFPDDEGIPEELLTPYNMTPEGEKRVEGIQRKYANRPSNIRRAWNRTQRFLPELMNGGKKQRVLELSTAHGAQLEVARHFGHEVMGCDYANMVFSNGFGRGNRQGDDVAALRGINDKSFDRKVDDYGIEIVEGGEQDWPYRPICEAIDLPMTIFDGGTTPYPFDDKSYDVTMCFQSIEHYCHPREWDKVLDEMCRITTKSIVLLLNPLHKDYSKDTEYVEAFDRFRQNTRRFNRNGFSCTATFLHWKSVHGFKLQAD
ncbi:class I SAM-dependent methyltransferase [Octadecabacter sp.]|nr:class I SAM-dependent methyltransferase [Octadecabacter sp.]